MERFAVLFAGIALVILGAILRWNLIDWLIDATGFILLVIGAILIIVGLFKMIAGGSKGN